MSEPRDWMSELSDLFERLVERALTADDRIRLNALLAQGVEARRYYRDYMRLHGALELRIAGPAAGPFDLKSCGSVQSPRCLSAVAAAAATRVPPISTVRQPVAFLHGSFGGAILSYAFAALLMVSGVLAAWTWASRPDGIVRSPGQQDALRDPRQIVGQITRMSGCRWLDPAAAPADGAYVQVGRKFALAAGQLEITYTSAYARVLLQGAVDYTVEAEDSGYLALGVAVVHSMERASVQVGTRSVAVGAPFHVCTPTRYLSDRGGDFAVMVDRAGTTRIRLDRGFVEVRFPKGITPDDRSFWPYRSTWASVYYTDEKEKFLGAIAIFGIGEDPLIAAMADARKDRATKTAGGPIRLERPRAGMGSAEEWRNWGLP